MKKENINTCQLQEGKQASGNVFTWSAHINTPVSPIQKSSCIKCSSVLRSRHQLNRKPLWTSWLRVCFSHVRHLNHWVAFLQVCGNQMHYGTPRGTRPPTSHAAFRTEVGRVCPICTRNPSSTASLPGIFDVPPGAKEINLKINR